MKGSRNPAGVATGVVVCMALLGLDADVRAEDGAQPLESGAPVESPAPIAPASDAAPDAAPEAPCVLALPRVASLARATLRSTCGSRNGLVHDGDQIALGARGHLRLQADLDEGRSIEVTCVGSAAPLSLTVSGSEAPWLSVAKDAADDVTCGAWSNNERVCATGAGEEVLVCDAIARAGRPSPLSRAVRPLGLPTWYVGEVVDGDPVATPVETALPATDDKPRNRLTRIAVYPLTQDGLDARLATIMTASVTAELRKLAGVTVIGFDEVEAMIDLEANKQLAGCDDSCLSEIAEALGVDVIVTGQIAALGDNRFVTLKRINQREAQVAGQVNERLEPGNGEEFLGVVGAAIEALFPEAPLKPGRTRGVAAQLAVRLNPPPLDPWVFWTGVGITGASVVGTSVVGFLLFDTKQRHDALIAAPPASGAELNAVSSLGTTLNTVTLVSAGITVVLAVATASSAGFVDWMGYRNALQLESLQ